MSMITAWKCDACGTLREDKDQSCWARVRNAYGKWEECRWVNRSALFARTATCGDCWMEVHPKAKICPHCRSSLQGVANAS